MTARSTRSVLGHRNIPVLVVLLLATGGSTAPAPRICHNATGTRHGRFFTFWFAGGRGCMTPTRDGHAVSWALAPGGNLVAGSGWALGSTTRVVRYRASTFRPGTNGYLALYGWSRAPLVEYYVVDDWGGFAPPGDAVPLGQVTSDGGTYRIYRTLRVDQPSIAGTATFAQYWSVRTARRARGRTATITFANHVAAWQRAGLLLGQLDYQVIATEGYASRGSAAVHVWEPATKR